MATGTGPRVSVGLDVGGTKIAAGVVSGGTVLERLERPTPAGGPGAVEMMFEMVAALRARHPAVEAVGVGAAGMVDWPAGHIRWAPNNAYHDLPLRKRLEEVTGLPAVVDNDANAAAWAEARHGAGAGHRNVLVVTVGTGVGGGFILAARLFRGSTGIGGEFGHITVAAEGPGVRMRQSRLPGGCRLRHGPGTRRAGSRGSEPHRRHGDPGWRPAASHG